MTKINKKILVVVAHPDDEVLGCGGTILKYINEGYKIDLITLTDGVSSRNLEKQKNTIEKRIRLEALLKSSKILGIKNILNLDFPDNKLDSVPILDIIQPIEKKIIKFKPGKIITHFDNDLNKDHNIVSKAIQTICRPIAPFKINEILFFEVLSSTEWHLNKKNSFVPNKFIDIAKTINKKICAFKCYKREIQKFPHSRSIEGIKTIAKYRGMMSGLKYSEAFIIHRMID